MRKGTGVELRRKLLDFVSTQGSLADLEGYVPVKGLTSISIQGRKQDMIDNVTVLWPRDGYYLSISRKNDETQLGLPGGKVDPGEEVRAAAIREVREETGSTVMLHDTPVYLGKENYGVTVTYLVISYETEPSQQPGEGFLKWATAEELTTNSPFRDYNARMFSSYDRIHRGIVG